MVSEVVKHCPLKISLSNALRDHTFKESFKSLNAISVSFEFDMQHSLFYTYEGISHPTEVFIRLYDMPSEYCGIMTTVSWS